MRTGFKGGKSLQATPIIEVAPDLVVEILSLDEARKTLKGKLRDYARIGVLEVWIANAKEETLEVLVLQDQEYKPFGLYGRGESLRSSVLPDFSLAVDAVFEAE